MISDLAQLQTHLGYQFVNAELLVEALTHPSYVNDHPSALRHNQRLEFLGDSVLQFILTDTLFSLYPEASEGELSRRRSVLARGPTLAALAGKLGFPLLLRLGGGENSPEGRTRLSNLEDAFEAFVGALFLDAGYSRTRELVLACYGPLDSHLELGLATANPKGRLQELIQSRRGHASEVIRYQTDRIAGADHAKEYATQLFVNDQVLSTGRGSSKKSAEEAAAAAALQILES
jgi:ribonuclease III